LTHGFARLAAAHLYHRGTLSPEPSMKKFTRLALLAALLPLGACSYGYSPGAWAGYDPSFDNGFKGYDRPVHYRDNYSPYENGAFGQGGNYYYGPSASWGDARGGDDYYATAY